MLTTKTHSSHQAHATVYMTHQAGPILTCGNPVYNGTRFYFDTLSQTVKHKCLYQTAQVNTHSKSLTAVCFMLFQREFHPFFFSLRL